MPRLLFAPRTHAFAVVRMDPVAMVQHLNDPEALRAAEALSPRSYLVYIDIDLALPFPGKPWYGFTMYPIGSTLRPANEEEGMTPDLCIPIFPNNGHPDGRVPLPTEPLFPFDNCYFWSGLTMDVRIHARPEKFDWDETILLPAGLVHCQWQDYQSADMARQSRAREARQPQPDLQGHAVDTTTATGPADDTNSVYEDTIYSSTSGASEYPDTLDEMFGFSSSWKEVELQPLFHLWCDVAANMKQDEIPSPDHLFEERDAIVK
ncbi:hypothetical protein L226DRAFT_468667 [Lentinus tigrinus ALCF2SS1-7]|uniref:Uncharacterized protein n=1 Tax=Lentinus tigrinus ALCF2SS1-6 TaxID=1328759 RepID=A0A5C2RZ66_9APHY|nr:hypothetical protein L227DRAFT_553587 [Lentinus tigrinus ALCF2SS1-6]RPD71486.1 hypothetical protein L226DRAFT_468667 [Lentinus tigrinus ALCF2SS1-7]